MEDWLDFDFRQMPMVQNPAYGQMPMATWPTPQALPYPPMQYTPFQPQPTTPLEQVQVPQSVTPPTPTGFPPTSTGGPTFEYEPGAPVEKDTSYTQGYLKTQIGKRVRIEFLIGTNMLTDRIGTLMEVGISYVIIQPVDTDDLLLADIYAIKFVTIFQ